ncbi:hypothetical protein ACFL6D_04535 [Spirochaetota bacterium]
MQIFINEKKIDFKIEKEENAFEVVRALTEWLNSQQEIVEAVRIDGREYFTSDNEKLSNIPLNSIQKVEISSLLGRSYALHSLFSLEEYLHKVRSCIQENKIEQEIDALIDGISWIKKVMTETLSILRIDFHSIVLDKQPVVSVMKEYEIAVFRMKESPDEDKKQDLQKSNETMEKFVLHIIQIGYLKVLEEKLHAVTRESAHDLLLDTLSAADVVAYLLKRSSENIQRGKDFEAMSFIGEIASAMNTMMVIIEKMRELFSFDLAAIVSNGKSIEEHIASFLKVLNDITGAFEKKDYVLLSDIIEYELVENIDDLKGVIGVIQESIAS